MLAGETIRDAILDAAENRARGGGYHGFSFREIAADVGIKSASVHYHFPSKADLARALIARYRERALEEIGASDDPKDVLRRLIALFRRAAESGQMCLCGAIGAASATLPEEVRRAAAQFTTALAERLSETTGWKEALPLDPEAIIALLEGALLVTVTAENPAFFERAVARLEGAAGDPP